MVVALTALVTWFVTSTLGFLMVALWVRRIVIGRRVAQQSPAVDMPPPYIPPPLVLTHFVLAEGGLLVWVGYVLWHDDLLAWAALAMLLPVALLGLSMLGRWIGSRRMRVAIANPGMRLAPAESHVPAVLVLCHGLFGAITMVLVLAAALGF